ncbi:MAG: 3'-5' exonuclease [Oscillospiraceae bacterium]|nr:3'-5' exonuclease [Oscillospiraceae bacterium]
MDFVAIDFETATSNYTSVCSLGICVVENDIITDRKEILIKPVPFEFNDYNIKIHGIKPEMVEDKPTFDMYWDSVRPYLENKTVIAHNADFDVGALCATLEHFNIPFPTFDYLCTVKLSQKAYPELASHKLNNLCDALGVSFRHHRAYDDAYACAKVLLRILEDYSLLSLDEIEECFEIEIGHLTPDTHLKCKKNKKKKATKKAVNE